MHMWTNCWDSSLCNEYVWWTGILHSEQSSVWM